MKTMLLCLAILAIGFLIGGGKIAWTSKDGKEHGLFCDGWFKCRIEK